MTFFHICCTDACLCPVHGTPMFFTAATRLHACTRPDCKYANGYENSVDLTPLDFEARLTADLSKKIREQAMAQGWTLDDLATCEQKITTRKTEDGYAFQVTLEKKR